MRDFFAPGIVPQRLLHTVRVSLATPQPVSVHVHENPSPEGLRVSGVMLRPAHARAIFVLAHGAGAGMHHPFLSDVCMQLAERDIATLRYQFPYMERKSRRPDPPALCHATVRAAIGWVRDAEPSLPIIAGGKSFGGRMTSQAQALAPIAGVRGLAFLGFPLHPANKPATSRADHLSKIRVPMLFLQGTRDALADMPSIIQVVERLGSGSRISAIEGADHSFHVPVRSGRKDAEILRDLAEDLSAWIAAETDGPLR